MKFHHARHGAGQKHRATGVHVTSIIGLAGTTIGTVLGLAGVGLDNYRCFPLDTDVYYLDTLPVVIVPETVAVAISAVLIRPRPRLPGHDYCPHRPQRAFEVRMTKGFDIRAGYLVQDLSERWRTTLACALNLQLQAGERVAIVGQSGLQVHIPPACSEHWTDRPVGRYGSATGRSSRAATLSLMPCANP